MPTKNAEVDRKPLRMLKAAPLSGTISLSSLRRVRSRNYRKTNWLSSNQHKLEMEAPSHQRKFSLNDLRKKFGSFLSSGQLYTGSRCAAELTS